MKKNEYLVMLLPVIVITNNFEISYILGLIYIIFGLLYSLTFKLSENISIRILIIALLSTLLNMIIYYCNNSLFEIINVYIIIIGLSFIFIEKKKTFKNNLKEILKISIKFLVFVSLFGLIREILGNNTITITNLIMKKNYIYSVFINDIVVCSMLLSPIGGCLLLGIIIGIKEKIYG